MLQVLPLSAYAATDLVELETGRWCGRVERADPGHGVTGWVLNVDAPEAPTELELTVGDDALVLGASGLPHPPSDLRLGRATGAAFRFGPEVFARLARLSPRRAAMRVGVRVAGTDVRLMPPGGRDPSVAELVAAWRGGVLAAMSPQGGEDTRGERMLRRLAGLRAEALALCDRPLRPLSDNDIGQIDAVHVGAEGQVWFVGWMKRGADTDFAAVVADREKLPAGGAVFRYERPDLNSTCVGVVGLLDTGWQPPPVLRDGFVYLGRGAQFHLRYGPHTRVLRTDAFTAAFAQARPLAVGGHAEGLAAVLHSGGGWAAGNAAAAGIAAEGGIDKLLMAPGFGCFAEGWAVSPAKRVETFQMRLGDCVLTADEASTSFRPRADLAAVFGGGGTTARAGFSTVLQGALPLDAGGAPLLRVVHDDGTGAVLRVEPKTLRRLDPVADGEELLALFPAIRHEPFWEAFLAAQGRELRRARRAPAVLRAEPCRTLVVLRLPGETGNLNLVFDRLARHLPELAPGTGLCVVADQGRGRAEALMRFEELRARTPAPLSLLAVPHGHDVLSELPFVLDRLGPERFVHVGRGVVLVAAGWRAAAASLERRGHGLDRFEILDDAGRPDRVDGAYGAACFGWSTPAFLDHAAGAPVLTRGLLGDSGLPVSPGDRRHAACALRVERAAASRLADMIDADLLAGRAREAA
ncbi:hypothetical protein D3218_04965 [Aureimonas flava]|uniref:Uncharacterized protein n=1 Tax=Aureimonas flava TaxID=2320271 RepID=A0A3A1WNR2_9HYPH|nr:hypothetical protein [Aureimonas flava]RIY02709.1 hypothetical protein D3218_04965 [Aureimonas flava]